MSKKRAFKRVTSKITQVFSLLFIILSSLGFSTKERSHQEYYSSFENMYLYDTLLLISDINKGIKIYSIADPGSPQLKTTIPLVYNSGVAMKDSIIFANSYYGLFALKLHSDFSYDTAATIKHNTDFIDQDWENEPHGLFNCIPPVSVCDDGTNGTGGSYALFAVIDSFLYYIDNQSLITIDISRTDTLITLSTTHIDWTIETLFATEKYLYIGGRGGMYVLDRTNPAFPVLTCTLQHFQAYDPVVVQDTTAYVTLRAGNWGGTAKDVLLVVNVTDPAKAAIINEIPTITPYGLTVRDTLLYVSNGYNGFSLYSVADPRNIRRIAYWNTPETKDFIWAGKILYTMGFTNIKIYDVSDPLNPALLSAID